MLRGYRYELKQFLVNYSELLSKFCSLPFQEYASKGILIDGELVLQTGITRGSNNFISPRKKVRNVHIMT